MRARRNRGRRPVCIHHLQEGTRVYSIMIWNTQHFDHQEKSQSNAYTDRSSARHLSFGIRKAHLVLLFITPILPTKPAAIPVLFTLNATLG